MLFVGSVMSLLMGISSDLFGILMGSQWREAGVYFCKRRVKKNTLSGNQQEMHYVDYRIHYNTFQRLSICRRFIYIFFSTSFPQPFGMWKAHRLWYMESVKGCFSYFIETDFCNSALPCRFKFYGGYKYLF